jgi:serine/threonine protein kinase
MCVLVALLCVCVSARYFDLKLENILVRSTGHLSLADMGLSYPQAKLLAEAPLICGTPAYMAPEQVRCGGNGALSEEIQKTVDWWALGLVTYEMHAGRHPFREPYGNGNGGNGGNGSGGEDDLKTNFVKILKCEVDYRGLNEALCSLVRALLCTDYRRRLGFGPNGTQDVKKHIAFNAPNGGDPSSPSSSSSSSSSTITTPSAARKKHGILVDWAALEARECKPFYLPEKRAMVDKSDTAVEYQLDPLSRHNTEAHQEDSSYQVGRRAGAAAAAAVAPPPPPPPQAPPSPPPPPPPPPPP